MSGNDTPASRLRQTSVGAAQATLRTVLVRVMDRQPAAQPQTAVVSASHEEAITLIRAHRFTGVTLTHWAQGVPKRLEFPNPVGIAMTR